MISDEGMKQDMRGIGLIYIDQFDFRLLSYRFLALSSNDIVTISVDQESPRETLALSSSASRKD